MNVEQQFEDSTLRIGELAKNVAALLPKYTMHIICSSQNIFKVLSENNYFDNVKLHEEIISAEKYYSDACLVITRSGRNTLSELACLGIPAISFVSGCTYRTVEQTNNINDLNIPTIVSASLEMPPENFAKLCLNMIGKNTDSFSMWQ